MPTNEKRRGVAERLREYPATLVATLNNANNGCMSYVSQLADVLGCTNPADIFDRLADLIEPESERTCHITRKPPAVKGNWGYGFCSFCGTGIEYGEAPFYCANCGARNVDDQKVSNGAMRIYRKLLKGLNDAD